MPPPLVGLLIEIVHVLKQIFPPAMKLLAGGKGKDPRYDQAIKEADPGAGVETRGKARLFK
jgi:hypothetical protein